jgi:ATP-dependent Clp protease adaptor protein ClpS
MTIMATVQTETRTQPTEETRTKRQPPYAVILHNDDITTMQFVVAVLQKVFGYTLEKCVQLMLEAHKTDRAVVWTGALELAELKADQMISCGPDPERSAAGAEPLRVTVEPA